MSGARAACNGSRGRSPSDTTGLQDLPQAALNLVDFKLDEMPPQRARGLLPQPSEVTAAALVRGPAQSGLGRP